MQDYQVFNPFNALFKAKAHANICVLQLDKGRLQLWATWGTTSLSSGENHDAMLTLHVANHTSADGVATTDVG